MPITHEPDSRTTNHDPRLTTLWLGDYDLLCQLVPACARNIRVSGTTQVIDIHHIIWICAGCASLCHVFQVRFKKFYTHEILGLKLKMNPKMLAQVAQMATARINTHFLLAQIVAQTWHKAGTNPLFPAQTPNRGS